jgi:hypothetical protein
VTTIFDRISDEPVLAVTLVQTILTLAVTFGARLTPEQSGAVLAVTGALLAIWARGKVTPA